ncbi:glycosyl transferase [Acanthocystis turfacea Chlorella virus OR0704.3]|nr:glycosyl transferase [Acanthocystis turfacea Chlorella virus OR0704.3]
MKILFASTSTNQTTGYGRISYKIISYLSTLGHDIHHFAFQNYNFLAINDDRQLPKNVHIIDVNTLSKEIYGTDIWVETIKNVNPDIIIIYNDMPVTCGLLNTMLNFPKPCKIISYLDIVYKFQKIEYIEHIARYSDHIFVFSDFWKKHLIQDIGISETVITVFPHGVDKNTFHKIPKNIAKNKIGLKDDDFVIFNTNRNSYRKLLDITIKSFIRFWKLTGCDSKIKLLINCRLDLNDGYNFNNIIKLSCIVENVDFDKVWNENIILLSKDRGGFISDEIINYALNASDIGVNTCGGEGFGLCNTEGAYLGVPQIVTNTGGLSDIFKDFNNMIVDPCVFISLPGSIDYHNGELAICDYKDFADKLLFYYKNSNVRNVDGERIEKHIRETYNWDSILEQFSYDIDYISKTKPIKCFYINKNEHFLKKNIVESQQILGIELIRIMCDGCVNETYNKAMKKAVLNNDVITIITDDNIVFPCDFLKHLNNIISKLPLNWEMIRIYSDKTETNKPEENTLCYVISRCGLFTFKQNNKNINNNVFENLLCFSIML